MKKIKILHFIHSLSGGGAEKQLRLLLQEINSPEYEVAVFCINDFQQDDLGSHVKIIKGMHRPSISLRYLGSVLSAIKSFNPHVAHIWLPASVTIPALFFSALLGKKVIFSYRSVMEFLRPLSYIEFAYALLFADKIISNRPIDDSEPCYRWLYRKKQGQVIYNSVSVPQKYLRATDSMRKPMRFIFAGRLTEQKNGLQLIDAMAKLPKDRSWVLDIYGVGEQRDEMQDLIVKHNLSDKIYLRGYCNDIYAEMANSDALLFPSLWEGMPNTMFEAFAIGLPVIASDIVANRHVVGDSACAIWVDPKNSLDITDKICEFLDGRYDIQKLIDQGRAVCEQYSLDRMVENYRQCYRTLLGRQS